MIWRIIAYVYIAALLGIGTVGIWMDCDPEFYAPPKLYWSRAAWIGFVVLYLGSFFIQPKAPHAAVKRPAPNSDAPPESN